MEVTSKCQGDTVVWYSTEEEIKAALTSGRKFYTEKSYPAPYRLRKLPESFPLILDFILYFSFGNIWLIEAGGFLREKTLVTFIRSGLLLMEFDIDKGPTKTSDIFFSQIIFKPND